MHWISSKGQRQKSKDKRAKSKEQRQKNKIMQTVTSKEFNVHSPR